MSQRYSGRPSWQEHYAAAQAYVSAHGEQPPPSYETADGIRVGAWLHNQRMSLGGHRRITPERAISSSDYAHPCARG